MIFLVGPICDDPLSYYQEALSPRPKILIAIDGGVKVLLQLGLIPDLWIGDMDSSSQDMLSILKQHNVPFHCYPQEKDFSDFELSLPFIRQYSPGPVYLYGMLGGRMDHLLFNIDLGKVLLEEKYLPRFCSEKMDLYFIQGPASFSFSTLPGQTVSLFPVDGPVKIETVQGLKYSLLQDVLYPRQTRGLSNEAVSCNVSLVAQQGKLLVFHFKEVSCENISRHC